MLRRSFCLVLFLCAPLAAHAACSRPMIVPISPSGMTTRGDGDQVNGFLPEVMRKIGKQFGCEWIFTLAPRARVEAMFQAGQSDLLLAATRSDKRDQIGYFLPMVSTRATVLSFGKPNPPIASLADLLNRRDVRVALVRGHDYGPAFEAMAKTLAEQNRLIYESNAINVARLLDGGIADVTVMTPIALAGLLSTDPRYAPMVARLRIDPVEELPWGETGSYISRETVSAADRATLNQVFAALAKTTWVMDGLKTLYPANVLRESVR